MRCPQQGGQAVLRPGGGQSLGEAGVRCCEVSRQGRARAGCGGAAGRQQLDGLRHPSFLHGDAREAS